MPQSLDIGQNSDRGIYVFQIFGQSLINQNCHNSRSSHDIDMKLGPVTKLENRKNATSKKKLTMDVRWENWEVLDIFPIYDQFGAIREPDSRRMVWRTYVFVISTLLSYKPSPYITTLSKSAGFCQIMLIFCTKNAGISKIREVLMLKGILSETI